MLYREIIAVCSQIHTKHVNTLCEQNVVLLNAKPGDKYSNHFSLNAWNAFCCALLPEEIFNNPRILLSLLFLILFHRFFLQCTQPVHSSDTLPLSTTPSNIAQVTTYVHHCQFPPTRPLIV